MSSTLGVAIAYTRVVVTDANREALAKHDAPRVSGGPGASTTMGGGDFKREFAKVKPPFEPQAIIVSPDGRV